MLKDGDGGGGDGGGVIFRGLGLSSAPPRFTRFTARRLGALKGVRKGLVAEALERWISHVGLTPRGKFEVVSLLVVAGEAIIERPLSEN